VAVLVVQGAFRNWNWMIKNTYRHCTRCEAGVSWVQARSAFRQIPGLSFDSASFAFDEMHFRRLQTYRQIEKIHIRYILGMVKVSILQT